MSAKERQQRAYSILDRPLRVRHEVSLSAYSWLFNEILNYIQTKTSGINEIEEQLSAIGYFIGVRMLDVTCARLSLGPLILSSTPITTATTPNSSTTSPGYASSAALTTTYPNSAINSMILNAQRPRTLIGFLQLLHGPVWKYFFGRSADAIEKSTEHNNEFYMYEVSPMPTRFLSLPRDCSELNCASIIGGMIQGMLESAGYKCTVSTHFAVGSTKTVYVIKVDEEVMKREAYISANS